MATRVDDCGRWQAVWLDPRTVRRVAGDIAAGEPLSWAELRRERPGVPPIEPGGWSPQWEAAVAVALARLLAVSGGAGVTVPDGPVADAFRRSLDTLLPAARPSRPEPPARPSRPERPGEPEPPARPSRPGLPTRPGPPGETPGTAERTPAQPGPPHRTLTSPSRPEPATKILALAGPGLRPVAADLLLVPQHPQTGEPWPPAPAAPALPAVPLAWDIWAYLAFGDDHRSVPRTGVAPDDVLRDEPLPPLPYGLLRPNPFVFLATLARLPEVRRPWLRDLYEELSATPFRRPF